LPEAEFRGPAECGDVYAAARGGAKVIGLIDGYFEQRLSVWHKEILWALAAGVTVVGGGSMGALRAAELSAFGMEGVGTVFEWIVGGVIEDDDEVAVVHEPAERGYAIRSEAMVNLRATFARAVQERIMSEATCQQLVSAGKRLFYPERSVSAVIARAATLPVAPAELADLERWLVDSSRRVDQKRLDALVLLDRLRHHISTGIKAAAPPFQFEYTEAWHELIRRIDAGLADGQTR